MSNPQQMRCAEIEVTNLMPRSMPIMLNVEGKLATVVGGGKVALRKVRTLLESGARVRVVSKVPCEDLKQLANDGAIELIEDEYDSAHLEGAFIAFACTDDPSVNRAVASDANSIGVLVNVADDASLCAFTMPAAFRRGLITVSVDTSGASPALAVILRDELASVVGEEHERLAQLLLEMRHEIKAAISEPGMRTLALREALRRGILQLLKSGDVNEATKTLRQVINEFGQSRSCCE